MYRPGGAHRPLAAALSLAIAGGIGATLILALVVPQLEEKDPGPLITENIPVPKLPDPLVEPDPAETLPPSIITAVQPEIIVPRLSQTVIPAELPLDRFPTTVAEPSIGGGGGIVRPVDPPRDPVFVAAARDPRFADRFQPAYPPAREREGVEGRCPVTVTIAPSGRVSAVVSNGCSDPAFLTATERQALRAWRFRPATRDGVAVESTQDVAVTFRIR